MPSIVCPRCRYVRREDESAPAEFCPNCGASYHDTARPEPEEKSLVQERALQRPASRRSASGLSFVLIALLVYGVWMGVQAWQRSGNTLFGQSYSSEEIAALAATVKDGDVVMYTTATCPYCARAKTWLNDRGFAFTECNVEESQVCARQFVAIGGTGVPYLVVKGKVLQGFDPDIFLTALEDKRGG